MHFSTCFLLFFFYPQTRSQLIKAGVKLLIQSKRKHSGCDSSDGNESSSGCGGGGGGGGGSYSGGTKRGGGSQQKMRRDTDNLTSEDDVDNHRTNSSSTGGGPGSVSSPRSVTGVSARKWIVFLGVID